MCCSDWLNVVSFPDPTPKQREPGRISCVSLKINSLLLTNLVLCHHEAYSMTHPVFMYNSIFFNVIGRWKPLNEKQLDYRSPSNLPRLVVGTGTGVSHVLSAHSRKFCCVGWTLFFVWLCSHRNTTQGRSLELNWKWCHHRCRTGCKKRCESITWSSSSR